MRETKKDIPAPDWQLAGAPHLWMPYAQMQTEPLAVPVVATQGAFIETADGRRLLDGLASWWTACHGYNHPHIVETVRRQLELMPHVMLGGIHHEPAARLASRLAGLLPGDLNHVFFSDSGSVSVEVALKMSFQYWLNHGQRGRHRFICFENAYHGDTMGAMSVCDPEGSMHAHFQGFLAKQLCHPVPHTPQQLASFRDFVKQHRHEVAAVIIEPLVQGAGGMKFHSPQTLAAISDVCRENKLLLIADEIATGFGRTGTMFACEQADVVPDIICLGKALTAGTIGLAATVATDRVFEAFLSREDSHALMHGPTFMGNPLACTAANASLDLFEREPRVQQAREMEPRLAELLRPCADFAGVVETRAKGAIGVVQVAELRDLPRLRSRFVELGVWPAPLSGHDLCDSAAKYLGGGTQRTL